MRFCPLILQQKYIYGITSLPRYYYMNILSLQNEKADKPKPWNHDP